MSKKNSLVAFAAVLGLGLAACASSAIAQTANGLEAFAGQWKINLGKTKMGRLGPTGNNLVRSPTFTWVFTPEGQGLRMDVYNEYPLPAPTRSMTLITDQKARPCENKGKPCLTSGGNPDDQTYAYYRMDRQMIARLFYTKQHVEEYSTYAVSTDGKTLTIISWSPGTPEYQNIQVFDKQAK